MRIALVGATGLVGGEMIKVLEESSLLVKEFIPVASEKSVGKLLSFKGQSYAIVSMETAIASKPDIAIFSAGGTTSLKFAPRFAEVGCRVVDNSSAWRMHDHVPLVVPEINAGAIKKDHYIIANPNCSTIQMLMVLAPLEKAFGIDRVVVSTYQSVTGTGVKAVQQLDQEEKGIEGERAYNYPIYRNCIPQCDVFLDNGYTKEEMKLINETHKILANPNIRVTATAVRVPVVGGHSESVNVKLKSNVDLSQIRATISGMPGVIIMDNPEQFEYPMPINAKGKNEVFVGRIRKDFSDENSFNLWIVADNLRKGAATNAVQIAEYLYREGYV
ncbi:MAG: aspartate-semialdehyde dehydrogenase [Flavobacteriales bacterium]